MELQVINFIRQNNDWEKILSEKPYSLTLTRKEKFGRNLMMLKYSQIDSDFSNPIVRECRGIILDEDTLEVVSFPFMKFGNYGEPYADHIDWNSAKILEKIDGSLIKIVRIGDELLISTNGTIDADDAPIPEQIGCEFKSFGDAVRHCFKEMDCNELFHDEVFMFDEHTTFMFELVSPYTKVVIPYPNIELYYLGRRDNITFQETLPHDDLVFSTIFKTPKAYSFKSLDDCVKAASELPWDEEGYVVVDKDFHRVKVKSGEWIRVHHLVENGTLSYKRAMEIIQANEIEEVATYFPNLKDVLLDLQKKYDDIIQRELEIYREFLNEFKGKESTRKDHALWIISHTNIPAMYFQILDGKVSGVVDWFMKCPGEKLVEILGLKEK